MWGEESRNPELMQMAVLSRLKTAVNKVDWEDKEMFLIFAKRMIKWRPGERSSAKELLEDTWLDSK